MQAGYKGDEDDLIVHFINQEKFPIKLREIRPQTFTVFLFNVQQVGGRSSMPLSSNKVVDEVLAELDKGRDRLWRYLFKPDPCWSLHGGWESMTHYFIGNPLQDIIVLKDSSCGI